MNDDERGGPGLTAIVAGYARAGLERAVGACVDVAFELAVRVVACLLLAGVVVVVTWAWRTDPWLTATAGAAVVALRVHAARVLLSTTHPRRRATRIAAGAGVLVVVCLGAVAGSCAFVA